MFRLRSKSGDESVFRTPEEIRAALLSGFVTPDAQIWDAELKGWVPLLEHTLYKQISAAPAGRKSGTVKAPPAGNRPAAPPASPTTAKPVQKLVIRRPGEGAPTPPPSVAPPHPAAPPAKPAAPPPPKDETPDLVMIDVDLSFDDEPEVVATPAQAPPAPATPPAPPPRPTPAPTPPPTAAPTAPAPPPPPPRVTPPPAPRVSAPRPSAPVAEARPSMQSMEAMGSGGSKKGLIIGLVVVLLAAGGGFFALRGRAAPADTIDSLPVTPRVAAADSVTDSVATPAPAAVDTVTHDAVVAPAPDTTPAATAAGLPTGTSTAETLPAVPTTLPVPFAPVVDRGATAWNARTAAASPLSIPELESVRLRYVAAQSRALEQFEAGLGASGFSDMFAPAKLGSQDRRSEALDAVDGARAALNDFRRRQAAIDFAYRDSLKAALPAGSDEPDLRTFGPILRETPVQAALTDSLVAEMAEVYGTLVRENGSYTLRGRDLFFKEQPTADRYRTQQTLLTAQLGRIRTRSVTEIPPAMGAILRGIGLPR